MRQKASRVMFSRTLSNYCFWLKILGDKFPHPLCDPLPQHGLIMSTVFHRVQQHSKQMSHWLTVIVQAMHKGRQNSPKQVPKRFSAKSTCRMQTSTADTIRICIAGGGYRLDVGIYLLKMRSLAPVTSPQQQEPCPTRIKPVS